MKKTIVLILAAMMTVSMSSTIAYAADAADSKEVVKAKDSKKSKKQKDESAIEEIRSQMQNSLADPDYSHITAEITYNTTKIDIDNIEKTIIQRKDENGEIIEIHCTYDPATKSGSGFNERKPNGTIHFVEATTAKKATFNLFNPLICFKNSGVVP